MLALSSSIDTLRRTEVTSQAIIRISARLAKLPASTASSVSIPCDVLSLRTPAPLTPQLLSLGVDEDSANHVSAAILRAIARLKEVCEADFAGRGRANSPARTPRLYKAIYDKAIREWSSYVINNFVPRFLNAQALHRNIKARSEKGKRPFNQNAVPILDQFFKTNAFPSRLQKLELASKCDMDYRQIHVWFQNRRSRSRKEGRELAKPTSPALSEELENAVVGTLLPGLAADEDSDSDDGDEVLHSTEEPFPVQAPPHAFPSPYPPCCSYDPFPSTSEERALHLPWLRAPSRTQHSAASSIDISALCDSLSRLSIANGGEVASTHPTTTPHVGLLLGFVTPCSRAPLPSLVCRPRRSARVTRPSSCCQKDVPKPRDPPRLMRWQQSNMPHPPTRGEDRDLWVPGIPKQTSRIPTREKRSLPRRYPKHPPNGQSLTPIPAGSPPSLRSSSGTSANSPTTSAYDTDFTESPPSTPPSHPMIWTDDMFALPHGGAAYKLSSALTRCDTDVLGLGSFDLCRTFKLSQIPPVPWSD